jgi:hypothetical protein
MYFLIKDERRADERRVQSADGKRAGTSNSGPITAITEKQTLISLSPAVNRKVNGDGWMWRYFVGQAEYYARIKAKVGFCCLGLFTRYAVTKIAVRRVEG